MRTSSPERRPTWELLEDFPEQGDWTVADYLTLTTNRLVEFDDGVLEFLSMPDETHQEIAEWVLEVVKGILRKTNRGIAKIAPMKVRVANKRFREPDVCVLLDRSDPRRARKFWAGADIAVEVVSADDPGRDYIKKRSDYARIGIAEYWIVDPWRRTVRQLALDGKRYRLVGTFRAGDLPQSRVLDGWTFDVAACMALIDQAPTRDEPAE